MLKKILSIVLATVMALGVLTVSVCAEDVTETEAKTVKISEIIASLDTENPIMLEAGDIIELDNTKSQILIFKYTYDAEDGAKAYSPANYTTFVDLEKTTGYEVKKIGDKTTYADIQSQLGEPIDFVSEKASGEDIKEGDYAFKGWTVTDVYSESNYNEITVCATWAIPELHGWDGFITMLKGYTKTLIEALSVYLVDLFQRAVEYFGGTAEVIE